MFCLERCIYWPANGFKLTHKKQNKKQTGMHSPSLQWTENIYIYTYQFFVMWLELFENCFWKIPHAQDKSGGKKDHRCQILTNFFHRICEGTASLEEHLYNSQAIPQHLVLRKITKCNCKYTMCSTQCVCSGQLHFCRNSWTYTQNLATQTQKLVYIQPRGKSLYL